MTAAPEYPHAKLRGITGDNHDRDRLVVSFDMPDGSVTRLSVAISDLETLSDMLEHSKPLLAKAWRKRDRVQR